MLASSVLNLLTCWSENVARFQLLSATLTLFSFTCDQRNKRTSLCLVSWSGDSCCDYCTCLSAAQFSKSFNFV